MPSSTPSTSTATADTDKTVIESTQDTLTETVDALKEGVSSVAEGDKTVIEATQESLNQTAGVLKEGASAIKESVTDSDVYQWTLGPILDFSVMGNPLSNWLIFFGVATLAYIGFDLIRRSFIQRIGQWASRQKGLLRVLGDLLTTISPFFVLLVAISVASVSLKLSPRVLTFVSALPLLALLLQVGSWGNQLVPLALQTYAKKFVRPEDQTSVQSMIGPLKFIVLLVLWSLLLLLGLDNIGVDVTALVAGLGVGGIAIALAVQNLLGDLFAAVSIVLDKPFVIGDFIIVSPEHLGHVEHIGLKTTRVRSLGGEQLIFANTDLLQSRIRNYKRMDERRILFQFGVVYQTSAEILEQIPSWVQAIVEGQELARFDRAHFASFGASSLDFEVVYYVLTGNYNRYMDTQQAINMALFKKLAEHNVEFAYPTQTLFIEK